jgi:branched-chain amino acid transport system permease protein
LFEGSLGDDVDRLGPTGHAERTAGGELAGFAQVSANGARPVPRAALARFLPAGAIAAVAVVVFPLPAGVALQGLILGLLGSLVAVGMALVYRANRILNFAQGQLGTAPTVLAVGLVVWSGWNYLLALTVGVVGAVIVGAAVELVVIRRLFRAPRLLLTVATLGVAQLLAVAAAVTPLLWGKQPTTSQIHVPLTVHFTVQPIVFSADDLVALLVAPLALVGVAALLRFTDLGIAIRASAEHADRASLLGIPVKRLQTVVWATAALLSFVGVFLQAGVVGLPVITDVNFSVLLASLAALVLGGLSDLVAVTVSAVALGLLQQAVVWHYPRNPELVDPIFAAVIVVCLLARRASGIRAERQERSSWRSADEVRPVPRQLQGLPAVRASKWLGLLTVGGLLVALPYLLDAGNQVKASAVVLFGIITVSMVVLTGWAGQVSLGQMSFAAFGATTGAYATQQWHLDLSLAMLFAGAVGATVALVVGLPALRVRGLFLAVTTLAFALATSSYLLNSAHFSWIPTGTVNRPAFLGVVSLQSQSAYYELCLACLVVTLLAVAGVRNSRTGRVLRAMRENEVASQAYGVNVTRAKLLAFAMSGFLAAVSGCLLVHLLTGYGPDTYSPYQSVVVFIAAVVGGVGSLLGGLLGALFLKGGEWFLPSAQWQGLVSAVGVLLVLMIIPGGLSDVVYRVRDAALRWIAERKGIAVPSLAGSRDAGPGEVGADESPLAAPDSMPQAEILERVVSGTAPTRSSPPPAIPARKPGGLG